MAQVQESTALTAIIGATLAVGNHLNHGHLRGARAIGVVCATDGPRAGYGPGVAILMTAPGEQLGSFEAPDANLVDLLGIED